MFLYGHICKHNEAEFDHCSLLYVDCNGTLQSEHEAQPGAHL